MSKEYTLRRTVDVGRSVRVAIDNGTFNDNFLIKSWVIFPSNGQTTVWAVLDTSGIHPTSSALQVSNNQTFGWAQCSEETFGTKGILDPNHIIVQDFYIHNLSGTNEIQVLIQIERVHTSDAEAALYMLKERAQGPLE